MKKWIVFSLIPYLEDPTSRKIFMGESLYCIAVVLDWVLNLRRALTAKLSSTKREESWWDDFSDQKWPSSPSTETWWNTPGLKEPRCLPHFYYSHLDISTFFSHNKLSLNATKNTKLNSPLLKFPKLEALSILLHHRWVHYWLNNKLFFL